MEMVLLNDKLHLRTNMAVNIPPPFEDVFLVTKLDFHCQLSLPEWYYVMYFPIFSLSFKGGFQYLEDHPI